MTAAITHHLLCAYSNTVAKAQLASIAQLYPHHFARAFKQSTDMPPHALLTARRMERAKELMLAQPELGLTEIALCIGYYSQAAVGTAFKRATGMSPNQWRRDRSF